MPGRPLRADPADGLTVTRRSAPVGFEKDLDPDLAANDHRCCPASDPDAEITAFDRGRRLEAGDFLRTTQHRLHLLGNLLRSQKRDGKLDLMRHSLDGELPAGQEPAMAVRLDRCALRSDVADRGRAK